ncbi:MAG: SET domain-containing protein [Actinomycetota bacterium]
MKRQPGNLVNYSSDTYQIAGLGVTTHPMLGRQVVTDREISEGEIIAIWRGREISSHEAAALAQPARDQLLQVGADRYLVTHPIELCTVDFINHSCDPNCGFVDAVTLVAMRPIGAGEPITFDYAMSDSGELIEFACRCGASTCRTRMTSNDWRLPELQRRYRGWFAPHVEELIQAIR